MRRAFDVLIFLSLALLIGGCDSGRYQIVTGSDGALYRFDKKTGELSMVMEDKKVVRLAESQKSKVMKEERESSLENPVNWKESKYPGKDLKVKLETVWRENRLCYKVSVYPYKSLEKIFARKKQDYIYSLMKPGFVLELLDKNGFLVKEIKVDLWNMKKADRDAGIAEELVLNSQIECTKRSYGSMGGYTIKWILESDMIEDDVRDFIKSPSVRSER